MDKKQIEAYRRLKDSGVNVQEQNQIRYNHGSESHLHSAAKAVAGRVALDHGYSVCSEVDVPHGSIDVLAWGHPERLSYAIEIEHSPTDDVKQSKLERYVLNTAVDDLVLINANELSLNVVEMSEQIREELGL